MPDASPAKWHLAHTTWFFETFLLTPNLPGYKPAHPEFRNFFNSYYEAIGDRPLRTLQAYAIAAFAGGSSLVSQRRG